jgi:hypothetical protein
MHCSSSAGGRSPCPRQILKKSTSHSIDLASGILRSINTCFMVKFADCSISSSEASAPLGLVSVVFKGGSLRAMFKKPVKVASSNPLGGKEAKKVGSNPHYGNFTLKKFYACMCLASRSVMHCIRQGVNVEAYCSRSFDRLCRGLSSPAESLA